VRIDGGKLYGRGAVDAKGPLAAFAVAAARLHARQAVEGRVVVVGCVEEEAPSSRGAHGVLDVYRPDFCIVGEPSGTDTITLGYKGSLRIRVRVTQESGHSAHDRRTAAESGFLLWQAIQEWASRLNRSRPRAWDQLLPALVGIHSGGDGLGDWCDLDLSLRLPEDMPPPNAEAQLRTLAGAARLEVLGSVPAFRAPRTSPVVRALIAGLRGEGLDPRFVVKTGTSDMNLAGPAWNCPIATYGPGDAALDHTPDEHIDLDDYLRAIRVLEHALIRLSSTRPITEATSYGYDLRAAGPGTFSDKSGAMCRPL
jgi:LysW-gamma-L-lysine carboxypeptidase